MNIHLGLALALILAGAVLVGVSLSGSDPRAPHVRWTVAPHGHADSAAVAGSAGQG
jgi:hypothetical protein